MKNGRSPEKSVYKIRKGSFVSGGNWETDVEKWDRERQEKELADFNAAQEIIKKENAAAAVAFFSNEPAPCAGTAGAYCLVPAGTLGHSLPGGGLKFNFDPTQAYLADPEFRRHFNSLPFFETATGIRYEQKTSGEPRSIPGDFAIFGCTANCKEGRQGETFTVTATGQVVQRLGNSNALYAWGADGERNLNVRAGFASAPQDVVKAAAILNYVPAAAGSGLHGSTTLLGVRIDMRQYAAGSAGFDWSSDRNGNAFIGPRGWAGSGGTGTEGQVFQAVALAAQGSGAESVLVNTLNYGYNTHADGRGMDLQSVTFPTGTYHFDSRPTGAPNPSAAGVAELNAFAAAWYAASGPGGYVATPSYIYGNAGGHGFGTGLCATELISVCGATGPGGAVPNTSLQFVQYDSTLEKTVPNFARFLVHMRGQNSQITEMRARQLFQESYSMIQYMYDHTNHGHGTIRRGP